VIDAAIDDIPIPDGIASPTEDQLVALVAPAQVLFFPTSVGDIAQEAGDWRVGLRGIGHGLTLLPDPVFGAGTVAQAVFQLKWPLRPNGLGERSAATLPVRRRTKACRVRS